MNQPKPARRVSPGTFSPTASGPVEKIGRGRSDPNWDWKNPNDNPSGEKPPAPPPHQMKGPYKKENYPVVFEDGPDSIHLFDPILVNEIKREMGARTWNKTSELEQIKTQVAWVSPPPTRTQREWTGEQWEAAWETEAKRLQEQIKR
jgi:hypothetical protein